MGSLIEHLNLSY